MYLGFMSGDFSVRLLQFTAHILRKCGFTPEMLMLENDKLYTRFKHAWEHLRYLNPCSIQQWRTFLVKKRKFGHWKCAVLCAIKNIKKKLIDSTKAKFLMSDILFYHRIFLVLFYSYPSVSVSISLSGQSVTPIDMVLAQQAGPNRISNIITGGSQVQDPRKPSLRQIFRLKKLYKNFTNESPIFGGVPRLGIIIQSYVL